MIQEESISASSVIAMLRETKPQIALKWTPEGFTNGNHLYPSGDLTIVWIYRFVDDLDPDDVSSLYIVKASDGFIGYTTDVYGLQSHVEAFTSITDTVQPAYNIPDTCEPKSLCIIPFRDVNLNNIDLGEIVNGHYQDAHVQADEETVDDVIHIAFAEAYRSAG